MKKSFKKLTLDERVSKLPVWAQDHINDLERDVRNTRRRLDRFLDTQTPTKVWVEDYVAGVKSYVPDDRVVISHQGVTLEVNARGDEGIRLQWRPQGTHGLGELSFVPVSYQQARITNLLYQPAELERLERFKQRAEENPDAR